MVERLEVFIKLIGPVEAEERKLTEAIQGGVGSRKIPKGVGPLSFEVLRREVGDWSRFNNRRQVSSYTGLCPREHSSGGKRRGGSVNKSGNPRVRAMLVEMVWRMIRWQPGYHALRKWMPVLGDAKRKCCGAQEGDRGGGAAVGGGPVATVHRADHRRKAGADLPAGSVLSPAYETRTEPDD